jgi:hypothetical protein
MEDTHSIAFSQFGSWVGLLGRLEQKNYEHWISYTCSAPLLNSLHVNLCGFQGQAYTFGIGKTLRCGMLQVGTPIQQTQTLARLQADGGANVTPAS